MCECLQFNIVESYFDTLIFKKIIKQTNKQTNSMIFPSSKETSWQPHLGVRLVPHRANTKKVNSWPLRFKICFGNSGQR